MLQQFYVGRAKAAIALSALAWIGAPAVAAVAPDDAPAAVAAASGADRFVDPLDAAAVMHERLDGRPLMAVASAGRRLVAVGMRGLVAVSDDAGKHWKQVAAPVRSDLLALSFPNASDGWAVGHDGVVLHTADGGRTWVKQFDGKMAAVVLAADYRKRIDAGDKALQPFLDQVLLNYKAGPSVPFLSVCFTDPLHGMAVGPFGMAIATSDGGKTWTPMLERIDNPQFLHLDAVRLIGGTRYIVGEQGRVYREDAASGRFVAIETGYPGSLFGIAGHADVMLAYGLKGTLYRSGDRGASWHAVPTPLHGAVTDAAWVPDRQAFALVTAAAEAVLYDPVANTFAPLRVDRPSVFTGVHVLPDDAILLSGLDGMGHAAPK